MQFTEKRKKISNNNLNNNNMKRKFTLLIAAVMLLTMMATTGTMWGQTRTEVTDVMNQTWTGVTGTSYTAKTDLAGSASSAVYSVQCAGGNSSIQLRSNNNNSGIVSTTSGGTVTKVTVTWNSNTSNGRTLNVYGSNSVYSAPSDLYGNNAGTLIGTIVCGTSTELDITDAYEYIGMRSASGAMYLTEIDVTWETGGGGDTPSISAENVDIAYDATSGAIEYTINNPVSGGVLTATTESNWLAIGTIGETVPFTCSANEDMIRTAQVTLTYTYGNDNVTKNVTVTQAANPNGPGSENNPYTVAQAHAAIDAGTGTQGVYAAGIVSEIVTAYDSEWGNITFDIVDEAGDENTLRAYRCSGNEAPNVLVGDNVVVTGNLTKYGSIYEFAQGCEIVSLEHTVTTHTLTFGVNPDGAGNVTAGNYTSPATVAENTDIDIEATATTGYVFSGWEVTGEGSSVAEATSATTTFTMGTTDATLTANFTPVATYTVTYYPNITGINPIEASYSAGENVTVANNTFINPGYAFSEWNTDPIGDGDAYSPGDVIENINSNINLYAQWEQSSEATDVLNWAATGSPTNYTDWTYTAPSGTAYAGQSSGTYQSIQLRSTNNNSGIITTTSVGTATKVVVVWNSNTTDGRTLNIYGKNTAYEAATDLYGDNAGDLLGSIVCGTSTELTISGGYAFIGMRAASGAMYFDEIDITWNTSGVLPPSISADDIELTYDATAGEIEYTINNEPTSAGTLTASTTETWLSLGTAANSAVPFNCDPNQESTARTATVTLTYTYGDNQTVTKDVTVTQAGAPVIYTTITDLFAAATTTATEVTVTFGNWHVTGISTNGKNVFVTDGTNGFVIYDNNGGLNEIYAVNDVISGTTTASLKLQNGFAQLTSVDADQLTLTQGSDIDFADIAMANLAGINTGALIHYENLTCSVDNSGNTPKYYLSDGTTQLQVYNSLFAFEALVSGKVYNISGVYQQYNTNNNTTKEVLPRSADDIEEVTIIVPTIIIVNDNIDVPAEGGSGTLTVSYENITDIAAEVYFCDAQGAAATYNWIVADIDTDNNVEYIIDPNDGEARTAYFKVYALDDDANDVYSNLVTINQAAPVVDYAVLPFEWEGGTKEALTALTGVTGYGLGSNYAESNAPYRVKFDTDGDYILVKTNEQPGVVTVGIKKLGGANASSILIKGSSNGVDFTTIQTFDNEGAANAVLEHTTSVAFNENDRYVMIYFNKPDGGSNVGVGPVTIEQVDNTPSITLSSYSVEAPCTDTDGSITVTYKNLTSFIADIEFYDDNNEPVDEYYYDWLTAGINSDNNVEYIIDANDGVARTAYFKVYAYYDNSKEYVYSDLVTVTQAEAQTMHTVTIDAKAYNQGTMEEVPFTGSISIASTTVATGSEVTITVNCDDSDGTHYRLESLSVVDADNNTYDPTLTKEGYVTTLTFTMPDVDVTVHMGIFKFFNVTAHFNGESVSQEAISTTDFHMTAPTGFTLTGWVWNETDYTEAGEHEFLTFSADDQEVWAVFQRRVGGTKNSFVKITTTDELAAGYYLIVCESENVAFNGGLETLDVAGNKIDVEIEDNAIVVSSENVTAYFGIFANQSNGYSIISYSGKYIGKTTDSNGMNTSDTDDYTNSIGFDNDGNADIAGSGGAYLRYNKGVNDTRFRYYKSSTYTSQQPIQLYKYIPGTGGNIEYCTRVFVGTNSMATLTLNAPAVVAKNALLNVTGTWSNDNAAYLIIDEGGQLKTTSAVNATVRREIAKAPTWNAKAGNEDGWYTISSPIYGDLTATSVTGLITTGDDSSYDLYKYDEGTSYWINYKGNNYEIEPGTGYLYSSQAGTMIEFSGVINKTNVACNLTTDGADPLKGFNLIGNPYSHNIYKGYAIPDDKLAEGYYILSKKGGWITKTDDDAIAPTQGILVKATTAGKITLTSTNEGPSAKSNHDNIQFMVSNNQYEDIAYAWFDKGTSLNKISHRNSNIPMIYIPQDGQNYAIATMSDDTKAFDLNFKAMTSGQYTLSFNAKGNYSYLHVIDRLTGEDIDMLLEGEYRFIGSPRDNEARFIVKLAYNANIDNESDNFAYQSGDEIIVNGNGELQVFDVTGRMVMNTNINGIQTVNVPTTGMYIFRMVGESVQTQKIVVR